MRNVIKKDTKENESIQVQDMALIYDLEHERQKRELRRENSLKDKEKRDRKYN